MSPGIFEIFSRRLQTSMNRVTVENSTAGLGRTLLAGRLLVDGLSFRSVSGLCKSSLVHRLLRNSSPVRVRRMSLARGSRPTICDPHAVGGSQCSERRSDLERINTSKTTVKTRTPGGSEVRTETRTRSFSMRYDRMMDCPREQLIVMHENFNERDQKWQEIVKLNKGGDGAHGRRFSLRFTLRGWDYLQATR